MKVLFISPYMTNNAVPLLSQCKAGFGYMVYDIAESVAKKEQTDALLYNYRYDAFSIDNIHFVGSSFAKFICNIGESCSFLTPFCLWRKYKMNPRTFIRLFYGWLISGYYYKVVAEGRYDVIHIHGCGMMNTYFIEICKKLNVPFVVTLHGLNSFSDSVKLEPAGKKYEKDFLKETLEEKYNMSVIASGIKRTVLHFFNHSEADNIVVINNSFKFEDGDKVRVDIRVKHSIPTNAHILLYVGNISSNKNQAQMIRAYNLLPEEVQAITYVLFLGRNNEPGYSLDEIIDSASNSQHLILCGNVDKNEIANYYQQADGVALLSITEGFGLSLIEGMHFGVPCMTFTDLDAFYDIYSATSVIAIPDRNDQIVADCMQQLLSKDWDKDAIREYSKRFESSAMADNYINAYKNIVQ